VSEKLISWSEACKAKVSYSYLKICVVLYLIDKDILKFNISVNNLLFLKEIKSEEHLLKNHPHIWLSKLDVLFKSSHEGTFRLIF